MSRATRSPALRAKLRLDQQEQQPESARNKSRDFPAIRTVAAWQQFLDFAAKHHRLSPADITTKSLKRSTASPARREIASERIIATPQSRLALNAWDKLLRHASNLGYRVELATTILIDGYTRPRDREIVIGAGQGPTASVGVLIHELAHIELGHISDHDAYLQDRHVMEVEAESVAYLVGTVIGLDTTADSAIYLDGWAKKGLPEPQTGLTNIVSAAQRIIRASGLDTVDRSRAQNTSSLEIALPQLTRS